MIMMLTSELLCADPMEIRGREEVDSKYEIWKEKMEKKTMCDRESSRQRKLKIVL